ncbi:MAG: SpoIIE family protein phosphatase [Acidobacteriota bacterium]
MSMMRNPDDPAPFSRSASWRKGVRYSLISMVIGLFVSFFIGLGDSNQLTPLQFAFGALYGLLISTGAWMTEVFFVSLLQERRLPTALLRFVSYFLGGMIGHLVAHTAVLAFLGFDHRWYSEVLVVRTVVFGLFAALIGLVFHANERLRVRLREREEALRRSELAAALAESELEIARSIQERLLPPPEIEGSGFRVSARNVAAKVVAGDFYDVFREGDSTVCCVVGDVAGKGVGASLIMASVKAVLPLMTSGRSVSEALDALNAKLHSELASREFVALVLVRFDAATGILQVANAGLPDPLLVRGARDLEPLTVPGQRLPLGAMASTRYEEHEVVLAEGDRLLLYSDGLPEARIDGVEVGYQRFVEIAARAAEAPSSWLDGILHEFEEADEDEDDRTLVALERREAPR